MAVSEIATAGVATLVFLMAALVLVLRRSERGSDQPRGAGGSSDEASRNGMTTAAKSGE
jgi:hypothetical protein